MQRAEQCSLKFNPRKTQYRLPKIAFMGCIISEEGVCPDPNKIKTITDVPAPTDKQGVLRFCGMAKYLNTFSPHLSQTRQPLFALTKADHAFVWSKAHQNAFDGAKQLISQAPCLSFFRCQEAHNFASGCLTRWPWGSASSAKWSRGATANRLHFLQDATKQRKLGSDWKRMSGHHHHLWQVGPVGLWSRNHCSHWPSTPWNHLQKATACSPSLPAKDDDAPSTLPDYGKVQEGLHHASGRHPPSGHTTHHQRLPRDQLWGIPNRHGHKYTTSIWLKSRTLTDNKQATVNDLIWQSLMTAIREGWPDQKSLLPAGLSPYWTYRDELTVTDGVIYKGLQVLVPNPMRKTMLQRIHAAHLSPESNIRMSKDVLFWPGMEADVQDMCQACGRCAQFRVQNQKEPMRSQPTPQYPWQFVSQDLCCFDSGNFLVTVDHYSELLEVNELDNTLSSTITAKTEVRFACYGIPEVVLTDNGPQFISTEYEGLCQCNRVHHMTSSPYWPQGNGRGEAAVKVIKRMLQKAGKPHLNEALLNYRNTPQQGQTLSPVSAKEHGPPYTQHPSNRLILTHARTLGNSTVCHQPKDLCQKVLRSVCWAANLFPVNVGDFVYLKSPPYCKSCPWPYGVVTKKPSPRSYVANTPTGITRRNRVHVHPAAPPPRGSLIPCSWQDHLHMPHITSVLPAEAPQHDTSSQQPPTHNPVSPQLTSEPKEDPPTAKSTCVNQPVAGTPEPQGCVAPAPITTQSGRISKPVKRLDLWLRWALCWSILCLCTWLAVHENNVTLHYVGKC